MKTPEGRETVNPGIVFAISNSLLIKFRGEDQGFSKEPYLFESTLRTAATFWRECGDELLKSHDPEWKAVDERARRIVESVKPYSQLRTKDGRKYTGIQIEVAPGMEEVLRDMAEKAGFQSVGKFLVYAKVIASELLKD